MKVLMSRKSRHRISPVNKLFCLIVAAAGASIWTAAAAPATTVHSGVVHHVVDGDSLYLRGEKVQIRLFGVDAPETDEIGYRASKDFLQRLAFDKRLACREVTRDKYARIVARCFFADGRELNRLMLDAPYTREYCRFSKNAYGRCD